MFVGAESPVPGSAPAGWERADAAARAAVAALARWRRRAREAEAEVARLRRALHEVSAAADASDGAARSGTGAGEELKRLRAENALLRSRGEEARRRVSGLLARLSLLEDGR